MTLDAPSWFPTAFGGEAALARAAVAGPEKSVVRNLLQQIDREVAEAPDRCLSFAEDGTATLTASKRTFSAGAFTTPSIDDLRTRAAQRHSGPRGKLVLSVLQGAHRFADIGVRVRRTAS